MTTGKKIKARRNELGITQKDLAYKLGLKVYDIRQFELDRRKPSEVEFQNFAAALGCKASDLKPDVMIDPFSDKFGAVCNCAVRYCLGRRSYMPSLVCGYITPLLPELTDKTLDCFERDIAERKRTGFDFGDSCDYETWDAFYKAVCKEIERRKSNADM